MNKKITREVKKTTPNNKKINNNKKVNNSKKEIGVKNIEKEEILPSYINKKEYKQLEMDINVIKDEEKQIGGVKIENTKGMQQKSKGDMLEYRLKRLIFAMGYIPKKGVIIKTEPNEKADIITDLDVYGVYFHKNFISKTIWADCKSGKDKPLERLSWIMGIRESIDVDDVMYVKRGVRLSTSQFAKTKGIQVLNVDILKKLEEDFNIEANDWRGSWNPLTQDNQIKIFSNIQCSEQNTFKKVSNFITSNYWAFDDYGKIKKTITALKQVAILDKTILSEQEYKATKWAIYELVTLLVLAMLNICKDIYYFSDMDKRNVINNGLIAGSIDIEKRQEIVHATYKVAYAVIKTQMPEYQIPLEIPSIGMNPPAYSEALLDMIDRITSKPLAYFDILRALDFILMEYDLENKAIDENILKAMFSNYEELKISIKTILHFTCSITGIPKEVFQLIKN